MAQLETTGEELASALGVIARMLRGKKRLGDALLGFDGKHLRIDLGGVVGKAPATGDWTGEARVAGEFILGLARTPPGVGPVRLVAENGDLLVEFGDSRRATACAWESSPRPDDGLPLDAGLAEKVAFGLTHTKEETARLGLTDVVGEAMERAERLFAAAAQALKPLGITKEQVRDLVRGSLRR